MSAVDHLGCAGLGAGEFEAPEAKRRLAARVLVFVIAAGCATVALAARHPHHAGAHILISAPLFLVSVALLGWSVRRARLKVADAKIRWGWSLFGFTARLPRLRWVRAYSDAVAVRPKRGSVWYLAATDWDRFAELPRALVAADIPVEKHERRAPFWARMQSYGRFLDVLLIINALVAALALVAAIAS
jgi:hypothetical protein